MNFLALFIRHCSQFPIIFNHEYEKVLTDVEGLIQKAMRCKKIPLSMRKPEDMMLLEEEPILKVIQALHFDSPHITIGELLLSDSCNQSKELQQLSSKYWTELFRLFVFFRNPVHSLAFLSEFSNLFYTPSQFAGLLIACIEADYPFEEMIAAGFMQNYFSYHIHNGEIITETYDLVRQSPHPKVGEFLELAHSYCCGMPVFQDMSLIGVRSQKPLVKCNLNSTNHFHDLTQTEALNIFSLLGLDFIILFLSKAPSFHHPSIIALLKDSIYFQKEESLAYLYQYTLHQLPQALAVSTLEAIGAGVPKEMAYQILLSSPSLFWMMISTAPQSHAYFTKQELMILAGTKEVQSRDIPFLYLTCEMKYFKKFRDYGYNKIFELFLTHSELELDEAILDRLSLFEKTKNWSTQWGEGLRAQLELTIGSHLADFSEDSFIDIRDMYLSQQPQCSKLKMLGYAVENYPQDHYDFTSHLLSKLLEENPSKDILKWIMAMIPMSIKYQNSAEELYPHVKRILLEWFKKTESPEALLRCASLCHSRLSLSLKNIDDLLSSRSMSLENLGLSSPTAMVLYLKLFHPQNHYKLLTHTKQSERMSLLEKTIIRRKVFHAVITSVDNATLMDLLCFQTKTHHPILFQIVALHRSVGQIFALLSEAQINHLLKVNNLLAENILHVYILFPKSLRQIIPHMQYADLISHLTEDSLFNESAFDKALEDSESFKILIHALKTPVLLHLCEQESTGTCKPYIESIFQHYDLITIFVNRLDLLERFQLYERHFSFIIKHLVHRPELLGVIFSSLTKEMSYALLCKEERSQPLIHHVCRYPKSLAVCLENTPKEQVLPLLLVENHKHQRVIDCFSKPIDPYMTLFLQHLPPDELMQSLTLPISPQRWVLDFFLSDIQLFKKLFFKLPPKLYLPLLFTQVPSGAHCIDLIPLNDHRMIQEILNAIPPVEHRSLLVRTERSLLQRALPYPQTFNLLLTYFHQMDILDQLFSKNETFAHPLSKMSNSLSLLMLIKALDPVDHLCILMHRHQTHHTLLQLSIHEPHQFFELLKSTDDKILNIISHKICNHALNCSPILEQPEYFARIIQAFPKDERKKCLHAICSQNQNFALTKELKYQLSDLLYPRPPIRSERLFQGFPARVIDEEIKRLHHLGQLLEILSVSSPLAMGKH